MEVWGCTLCGRIGHSAADLTRQGCEGRHERFVSQREIPDWLLAAREQLGHNLEQATRILEGEEQDIAPTEYWGGYYDACRHALEALPPYVKHPDAKDWRAEGFDVPGVVE